MKKRRMSEKRFETKLARLLERRLENAGGRSPRSATRAC